MKCQVRTVTAIGLDRLGREVCRANNECNPFLGICWRKLLGYRFFWLTGLQFKLCRSHHAEAELAKIIEERGYKCPKVVLYGHYWMCGPCCRALKKVGVEVFIIREPWPKGRNQ